MKVAPRALTALLFAALVSCAGPADEPALPDTTSTDLSELRPDNAGISATLSATKSTFGAADAVSVTLTITNHGKSSLSLLRWFGPSAELEENLFAVARDGAAVQYIGADYKRPAPTSEDLLSIAPGQSASQQVSLSGAYDLSATGAYAVRYEVAKLEVTTGSSRKTGTLKSNELVLWVEGRKTAPVDSGPITTLGAVSYAVCDTTQQGLLSQALSQATTYASGAESYLSGASSATPRFTTWFGTYSSARWGTAKTHYTAIRDAFQNKAITFNCKCKQKYYAYVYPTQPYTIYLCNAFWTAPMSGTDSKGGTLVHEMSHFNVTAGTDDWAYGQSACKSLAISNPTNALDNADSHEYFAENTPAQQ